MNAVASLTDANYREPFRFARQPSYAYGQYAPHKEDYVTRFHRLVHEWRIETAVSSRLQDKIDHPAFAQIVAIGAPAIPLIIRELQIQPDFLFLALHRIVGDHAIPAGAYGSPTNLIDAWLDWANQNRVLTD